MQTILTLFTTASAAAAAFFLLVLFGCPGLVVGVGTLVVGCTVFNLCMVWDLFMESEEDDAETDCE